MDRTAVEIVRAYGVDAWTNGRDDLIPELCHDPITRHDADREVRLSHAEQRARMRHNYEELRPVFEDVVLAGDDEYVTLVWNVTGRDPNWKWCGIEVFRVVDGRIAEVWNSPYMDGRWGLSKSLAGRDGDGAATALPLVRSDLVAEAGKVSGQVLVPADAHGMAWWLTQLFGTPVTEPDGPLWRHRFASGGAPANLSFTLADKAGSSFALRDVAVPSLNAGWERSGLINATVPLTGTAATIDTTEPLPAPAQVRLAETIGTFDRGAVRGRVVDAHIAIAADGTASGKVALRLDDPQAAAGEGRLSLGWREGAQRLVFEGTATLAAPTGAFADDGTMEASFAWEGSGFTATLVNDRPALAAPDL